MKMTMYSDRLLAMIQAEELYARAELLNHRIYGRKLEVRQKLDAFGKTKTEVSLFVPGLLDGQPDVNDGGLVRIKPTVRGLDEKWIYLVVCRVQGSKLKMRPQNPRMCPCQGVSYIVDFVVNKWNWDNQREALKKLTKAHFEKLFPGDANMMLG